MQVNTKWFGTVDIDDNKIITFDLGIIGFEYCKQFTLIYDVDKGDEAAIMWLQSLDEAALDEARTYTDAPTIIEFMISTDEIVLPMVKSGNPMSEMILK